MHDDTGDRSAQEVGQGDQVFKVIADYVGSWRPAGQRETLSQTNQQCGIRLCYRPVALAGVIRISSGGCWILSSPEVPGF